MAVKWPRGVSSCGVACGIKDAKELDLGLLVADSLVSWAGAFTRNAAAAASVGWSKSLLAGPIRAIVVNSGNANACTGSAGAHSVSEVAQGVARQLGCVPEEVAVASTGRISVPLPVEKMIAALPGAMEAMSTEVEPFARAILTTDTVTKVSSAEAGDARVVGVAKGAAMIAPSMATMLAFLVTDAALDQELLAEDLSAAISRTFDRISVDGCESTNDSVFLMATGYGRPAVEPHAFSRALEDVCADLAEQIVRDAEGGSKLMRVRVSGAQDEGAAVALGRAVAASALWRAAVHGADPNWGRVLAALGARDRSLDLSCVELRIGPEVVFSHGEPAGSLDVAGKVMEAGEFTLSCVVGRGPGSAEVLSSDLSPSYVELNAEGMT